MPSGIYPRTPEHNAKISAAAKKRWRNPEERKKLIEAVKGKNTGDKNPAKRPEVREKISIANTGKKRTAEQNEKNSASKKIAMNRPEVRERCRKAAIEQFQDPRKRENHRRAMNRPEVREKQSTLMQGENNPSKRPEVKEKMRGVRPHMRGGNNPNWKGGISEYPYSFEFNEEFKTLIRERDDNTCQLCGRTKEEEQKNLVVHHIYYDKDNSCSDESNFTSLCNSCNTKVNFNREYWKNYFSNSLSNLLKRKYQSKRLLNFTNR